MWVTGFWNRVIAGWEAPAWNLKPENSECCMISYSAIALQDPGHRHYRNDKLLLLDKCYKTSSKLMPWCLHHKSSRYSINIYIYVCLYVYIYNLWTYKADVKWDLTYKDDILLYFWTYLVPFLGFCNLPSPVPFITARQKIEKHGRKLFKGTVSRDWDELQVV